MATQMPWIQHGPNIVSDSQLIIGYLMSTYGDSVKVATVKDPALHATATAAVALCETYVRDAITFYRAMDAKVCSMAAPVQLCIQASMLLQEAKHVTTQS